MRPPYRPSVGVDQAEAYVATMRAIQRYGEMDDGWDGDGSLRPRAPAVAAARRVMTARQLCADRLTATPLPDGGVALAFVTGAAADGAPGFVHIDRAGRPAIVDGPPRANPVVAGTRPRGCTAKGFSKALDVLISPNSGRYNSRKVEIDGHTFDSAVEARRYVILRTEQEVGHVEDLRRQIPFPFMENGRLCFTYYADFVYKRHGIEVVEDVKGVATDVYKLKKKLVEARHGVVIEEWPVSRKELARRAAVEERRLRSEEKARRKAERAQVADARRIEREAATARRAAKLANREAGADTPAMEGA